MGGSVRAGAAHVPGRGDAPCERPAPSRLLCCSSSRNAEVASRWADLFDLVVPQEVHAKMQEQKKMCAQILQAKEVLVQELRGLLKNKDDSYIKLLKRQSEEIDILIRSMTKQYRDLEASCKEEVERCEAALMTERDDLLEAHKGEISGLFAKRFHMEQVGGLV